MNIIQIQKAINKFRKLPLINREKNVFDIVTRGHEENLTTDVLSFFCDGSEVHKLGNLLVDSLISELNQQYQLGIPCCKSPVRSTKKVVTKADNCIALLIESDQYLLVIDVQYDHYQNTFFDNFEYDATHLAIGQGKSVVHTVLSMQGQVDNRRADPRWVGLSFNDLVQRIIVNLQQHFFEKAFNPWLPIFKDFLLHLENLMNEQNNTQFALQNLADISAAWQLLSDTLSRVDEDVQASVIDSTGQSLIGQKQTWFPPLPAYVYQYQGSQITVILFASTHAIDNDKQGNNEANRGKHLFIQVHVDASKSKLLYQKIIKELENDVVNYWEDNTMGYLRWPIKELSLPCIVEQVSTTLSAVHAIELTTL